MTKKYLKFVAFELVLICMGLSYPIFSHSYNPLTVSVGGVACRDIVPGEKISIPLLPQVNAKFRKLKDIKSLRLMSFNVENLFVAIANRNQNLAQKNALAAGVAKASEEAAEVDSPVTQADVPSPPSDPTVPHRSKPEEPEYKSEKDIEAIRKIILENDADIIVLAEVENLYSLQKLAAGSLGDKYRAILVEGNDERGIDIGFLVKNDLPLATRFTSYRDLDWYDSFGQETVPMFSRDLPTIEFSDADSPSNTLFAVIGNHAKSKRDRDSDFESVRYRTAQYQAATKIVKQYRKRGIPIIFGGDFNVDVRTDAEVKPLKSVLTSAFDVAESTLPVDQRITHTFHPKDGPSHFAQMDDLMVSSDLRKYVSSASVVRYHNDQGEILPVPQTYEQRALQPSDHFPVMIDISTVEIFGKRSKHDPNKK